MQSYEIFASYNFKFIVMAKYSSKKGVVSKAPYELYMGLTDLRNILNMIPQNKREGVIADYDSIHAKIQGFDIGVRIIERTPYSQIVLKDDGAPFAFTVALNFEPALSASQTIFSIDVDADLNFMMKTLLGSKIKDALDKVVDGLVDASNGRTPEGFDASKFGR